MGFTLVELVIALSIIVILAMIAVPGLQALISSNDRVASYNDILSGIKLARSEAITRREAVTAELEAREGGGWELAVYDQASGARVLSRRSSGGDVSVSGKGLAVTFNTLGRPATCTPSDCVVTIAGQGLQVTAAGRVGTPITEDSDEQEDDGGNNAKD